MAVYRMRNHAQNYDWGSRRMIPALQAAGSGVVHLNPEPVAEIWMGTHPRGPSSVEIVHGGIEPLTELLSRGGDGELPFLFKILTAERGLSIQTHPSRAMAEEGFHREETQGVDIGAAHRTYRDRNHKPELLCAVDDFWGLRGFRPLHELKKEMARFAKELHSEATSPLRAALERFVAVPGEATWREAFATLLRMAESGETAALEHALHSYCGDPGAAGDKPDRDNRYWWCRELMRQFPGDAGAAAPLYLNLVHLHPGEAVFLEAGVLHAYLYGAGVELMASSDNVLRAGCTSKHVNRSELLRTLTFTFESAAVNQPETVFCGGAELLRYRTAAAEFELLRCSLRCSLRSGEQARRVELTKDRGAAIVLSVGSSAQVSVGGLDAESSSAPPVALASTESALVDYETNRFSIDVRSPGTVYVASVPGAITCDREAH